jgi:hypothetical protein
VIIMVGAHVTDAWTRVEDRKRTLYMITVFIAGMARRCSCSSPA